MKRGRPPKRTKGLHVNPETVRAFLRRGGGQLKRTGIKRTAVKRPRKKPQRPREGPLTPSVWRREVLRLDFYRSRLSGLPVSYASAEIHHAIPKQELRRRRLYGVVWDPRGAFTLTEGEHSHHTLRVKVVPYEKVPQRCKDFARELGPWAEDRLLREHPPAGHAGTRREEDEDGA